MKMSRKYPQLKPPSILLEQRDGNLTNLYVASSVCCVNAELPPTLYQLGTPNLGRFRFSCVSCVSFCIRMHVHNAIMQHLPPRILSHALPALYDSRLAPLVSFTRISVLLCTWKSQQDTYRAESIKDLALIHYFFLDYYSPARRSVRQEQVSSKLTTHTANYPKRCRGE